MVPWLRVYPTSLKARLSEDGFKVPPCDKDGCIWVDNLVALKIKAVLEAGRVAGPFNSPPFANFRLSPLGLVPKKEPNSYRLIHNLSFPHKISLNITDKSEALEKSQLLVGRDEGIGAVLCTLSPFSSYTGCLLGQEHEI